MTRSNERRLADEPHHDGSLLAPGPRTIGSTVRARVRVPLVCGTERLRLRTTPDAEPDVVDAEIESESDGAAWWAVDVELTMAVTNYRFLLEGGRLGRCWLNGAGVFHRDVTDAADFRISTATAPPGWLHDTVGYQIFIDRFARSGTDTPTPDWAITQGWHDAVDDTPGVRSRQWFGGDLLGIEQHLEHLERLGVTLIYLTPFFPAGSMHRYDASTFERVDPALGGDDALASLIVAAHARGIRVIGDITLNHTGVHHDWFTGALAGPDVPERNYYFFDEAEPYGYVAWHGVASLPKLDHRSDHLRRRFHDGAASVAARYLSEPFGLDGWRVDCANTTARHGTIDDNHAVAHALRATMGAIDDERWLLAEHCYDASSDLDGTGWHGVMAYQWFTRPLWGWLKGPEPRSLMAAVELIDLDGVAMVESMRHLAANVSWDARQASMTMLDSHDTARFRTVVDGDPDRHLVGLVALFTMPGVPTLFAGSEVGVGGDSMDTGRVPFPWDSLDDSEEFLGHVRALIALRRTTVALQQGTLRWIDAGTDSVTYVRETDDEVILVHLVRAPTDDIHVTFDELGVPSGLTDRDHFGATMFAHPRSPGTHLADHVLTLPGDPGAVIVSFPRR
ncbi:MAG TPA: glycoside hydrolase family 13 protein [Ilumatobacteraceae bacterium]|nr:glycoside hydrolase family 13 protein [Ilumatobacteraceae bacterium]